MLKIGMIGAGHEGQTHLDNWKLMPGIEVIGFYDPDDEAAKEVSEKYPIPRFLDAAILVDSCDAIDLTTPVMTRSKYCEKAIKKGKHVFTTSPFAYTVEEARQIIKLVEESGIKLQVECRERFNPAILALKDLSPNPSFIEMTRHALLNNSCAQKDIVFDILIHDIDLVLNMVKSDVKSISSTGVRVITEEPDIINVRLEFHNGCVAQLTCSRIAEQKERTIRFFQPGMYIGVDLLNKKAEVIKIKESKDPNVFTRDIDTGTSIQTVMTDQLFVEKDIHELQKEMEEFRNAILTNAKPAISETDGLTAIDIARQVLDKVNSNPVIK